MRIKRFRLDAIRALGTLGDPSAIPKLQHVMDRWWFPWADRLQAAAALCALCAPINAAGESLLRRERGCETDPRDGVHGVKVTPVTGGTGIRLTQGGGGFPERWLALPRSQGRFHGTTYPALAAKGPTCPCPCPC